LAKLAKKEKKAGAKGGDKGAAPQEEKKGDEQKKEKPQMIDTKTAAAPVEVAGGIDAARLAKWETAL